MELEELADIVENMALQHDYPGFDIRTLKLGLPASVLKAPPKLFGQALRHDSAVVRLAALRFFIDKPGSATPFYRVIGERLNDTDEVVRSEAVHCFERMHKVEKSIAVEIAALLKDEHTLVRKCAAKALGKIGLKDEEVVSSLKEAAQSDKDHEVRWKAQKALRLLGAYVA